MKASCLRKVPLLPFGPKLNTKRTTSLFFFIKWLILLDITVHPNYIRRGHRKLTNILKLKNSNIPSTKSSLFRNSFKILKAAILPHMYVYVVRLYGFITHDIPVLSPEPRSWKSDFIRNQYGISFHPSIVRNHISGISR